MPARGAARAVHHAGCGRRAAAQPVGDHRRPPECGGGLRDADRRLRVRRSSSSRKSDHHGPTREVLDHERVAALERDELGAGYLRGKCLAVGQWCDAVIAAGCHEGRDGERAPAGRTCRGAASLELSTEPRRRVDLWRPVFRLVASDERHDLRSQRRVVGGSDVGHVDQPFGSFVGPGGRADHAGDTRLRRRLRLTCKRARVVRRDRRRSAPAPGPPCRRRTRRVRESSTNRRDRPARARRSRSRP